MTVGRSQRVTSAPWYMSIWKKQVGTVTVSECCPAARRSDAELKSVWSPMFPALANGAGAFKGGKAHWHSGASGCDGDGRRHDTPELTPATTLPAPTACGAAIQRE